MEAPNRPDDAMRMLIIAVERGTILGAVGNLQVTGKNPPVQVEVIPTTGQIVREVEVPPELLRMDPEDDILAKYRLEYDEDGGRLVER